MSTPVCQTVSANTDVLGIGIRINFYYTILLLAVIPQRESTEELLNTLYTTAGTSGFGLLLTAIIQTAKHKLSLFHALFILHILFFLGIGASPMGKYRWTRSRVVLGVLIQYASVVIFAAWSLYLWANVKDYGSQPECNDQIKYVLFFVTVRATAPWLRDLWITALALGAVGLMVWFGVKAVKLFVNNHVEEAEEAIQMKSIAGKETPTETPETPLPGETEQSKKSWYFHVSRSIPFVFSAIYATVMLELTVSRNAAHFQNGTDIASGVVQVDNTWAFGQVLSVVMIFVNVNEILHFLFGFFARRKLKRQAQTEETGYQVEGRAEIPSMLASQPFQVTTSTSVNSSTLFHILPNQYPNLWWFNL
ncbi:hypothetical protein DFH94DRAFT_82769 [Russula ochroleuca]|uniref:Uncharacterized protein n=1 Tax=Russula ochroleuca TaxID=152965 RepID=A0A9P5T6I9_9AGAM|nr:hypothetical protein DFH94DRAFT_82769 [Russula ochroleuca]